MLRQGATGIDVVRAQTAVNSGGALLKTDGIYGPLTGAALVGFQGDHGLPADGVVGRRTWAALLGHPVKIKHHRPAAGGGATGAGAGGGGGGGGGHGGTAPASSECSSAVIGVSLGVRGSSVIGALLTVGRSSKHANVTVRGRMHVAGSMKVNGDLLRARRCRGARSMKQRTTCVQ